MISTDKNKQQRIKDLEKENESLLDRCANLELDLTERVKALENEKTTARIKAVLRIGDMYR